MDRIICIPALEDNYIWGLTDPAGRRVVIFDPGQWQPVVDCLMARNLELTAIFLTHHHFDHTGGVEGLLKRYDVPVFGPGVEVISSVTIPLAGESSLDISGVEAQFRVFPTPGHTDGHIVYRTKLGDTPLLFSGDTLFSSGCGRVLEGSYTGMYASLLHLKALEPATLVYCAHEYTLENLRFARAVEPENTALQEYFHEVAEQRRQGIPAVPTTIASELLFNPFLRCDQSAVYRAACGRAGKSLESEESVFEVLRRWKNGF